MKCPRCQQETPSDADFCPDCGVKLAGVCASCGTANAPNHKFCKKCGQALGVAGGPSEAHAPSRSPSSYTPQHLAEKILTSKSALEGERKQVTVLFADLKGSMELLADRDPEEARKILDPILEVMMEAVHRYEGIVNQVMGDGIMALFGAPVAHEDHAVRACYAALRMQESVKRNDEGVRRHAGINVRIRVGLNSGEVVVRAIGSDLHMDYTAVGQTTHLAARMEQMAAPGTIVIPAATLKLAQGYVEAKPLGATAVKGLTEPIEIYEVMGGGPVHSRFQAAAARGLTRFVGRERDFDQVRDALDRARAGRGQIVAVMGEAGVGKSRLGWELTQSRGIEGWRILEAGAVSYSRTTPYLPILDLLKRYFEIKPQDDAASAGSKIAQKLVSLDRALEPSRAALLSLLDLPVDDPAWAQLAPPQRRQHMLDGIKRLLLGEAKEQPLIVLIEDLHWIDSETQALLDSLVDSLPTARLLLLVNYRPEYQHGWGSKTYYTQIRLDPLPPTTADRLLEDLLGSGSALDALRRALIERTEGNPFFLEESVRTLVETGTLVGERGGYRLAKPVEGIQVPATIQTVLAARIDRLPPEDKRLLQSAAVIGKDVSFALLQAIADLPESDLRGLLNRLQAAEFLYEAQLFPDLQYTFKHALTHEVAYGSLLQERSRLLHGRVVSAIEELYVDRLGEQIESLAHHAFRGELWEKAVSYLRQAGAKAMPRAAHREARAWFEQALHALEYLPQTRETLELAIDLRFDLWSALAPLGDLATILQCLGECQSRAEALGDRQRLTQALSRMPEALYLIGDYTRAIEVGERGLTLAEELGDRASESGATANVGRAYHFTGDYPRAVAWLRRSVAAVEGNFRYEYLGAPILRSVICRTWLVWALADLGEFAEGRTIAADALQIAEQTGHPLNLVSAHLGVGLVHLQNGELTAATATLERSLEILQGCGISGWFHYIARSLGFAYALAGHLDKALPLLEHGVQAAVASGKLGGHPLRLAQLGEGYLLAGRMDDAIMTSQRALDLAVKHKERGNQAWTLRLLGEIAAHRDPPCVEDAQNHYHEGLAQASELGMRPLVAHCHLGLGKLYRRTDKREQAREHLATATTMYREMGMTYWLEKAEAEVTNLRT
jgi:class 3 adenylate cyclase/tetratricopeptide (TPR) repeat protein